MKRKKEIDKLVAHRAKVTAPDDEIRDKWHTYERTLRELLRANVDTKGADLKVDYLPGGYGASGEWSVVVEYNKLDTDCDNGLGNTRVSLCDWQHLPRDATFKEIHAAASELCSLVQKRVRICARALIADAKENS